MKPLSACHVLVTPTSYGQYDDSLNSELAEQVGRVTYNDTGKPLGSAELGRLLADVDGYIAGLDEIDAAALDGAGSLQVIARYGVGVNNVDLAAAGERGIVVTNTPAANARSVAELTIALLLLLARPIMPAAAQTRAGGWPRMKGLSLEGKTVGLIGLGAIGRHVAEMLLPFGCRVLTSDPVLTADEARQFGCDLVSLDTLLAGSDVVSLHAPATAQTTGMVNADFLAQMKPGASLINTSRGELVVEADLLEALHSGRLRGAALDAFAEEPPGADNPLLALPQVIATPHMGAHTDGAASTMGRLALDDCLAVLRGDEPKHRVVKGPH